MGPRRVIAQQWVSVDGFASGLTDESEIFSAVDDFGDSERHNQRLLDTVDEVLLGRRTYETFVQYWPTAGDEPMAARVNELPKIVCSGTLDAAPWGDFLAATVVPDAAAHLRDAAGTTLIWGSLHLMTSLWSEGLLDEIELFVAPVTLGAGTPVAPPQHRAQLRLLDSDVWPSGVARLHYKIDTAAGSADST
ncbi:dihydrofolate reductase family protein [Nakamurella alba]|nr:dihydrofolate reductase family protein [Nakamurella alba]